jgi:protein ImuB
MAFACIYIPHFPLQAIVRAEPALLSQPVAVVDGTVPILAVVTRNERARQAGVELGMTKSQAAEISCLQIRLRSPVQETAAQAALVDLGLSFSPRMEEIAPDTIVLDLDGLGPLFGPPETIAQKLAGRAERFGFAAQVAVSGNLEAALHAARGFSGTTVIPPGEESERLGCLPVSALGPPVEILETLERWGVRTCKALAALPAARLSERLGQEGVRLQEMARGASLRPLVPAPASLQFEEAMELEGPLGELEPLAFILGRLLHQLCERLSARALATNELCLTLELENSREEGFQSENKSVAPTTQPRTYQYVLRLPVPMRGSKTLLKLLRLHLESHPPQASVLKVWVHAQPMKLRVAQAGLFLPLSPDPEKLELTMARVAHLVGDSNVGSPEVVDTHRPGAFRMKRLGPPRDRTKGRRDVRKDPVARGNASSPIGFRVFRPPLRATVQVKGEVPLRISFGGLRGDVLVASGPWRSSGDWWAEDAWEQEEWDLEISFRAALSGQSGAARHNSPNGFRSGVYRVYRELATGNWFVRGVYD